MQIRQLLIKNFRGISSLEWKPENSFCCLIGPGDSGKSTILDAIEAVLSSKWFTFIEPDFFRCNTATPIVIEATIGELSRALKSDDRFGLYIRGWTAQSELHDEPEDGDEAVLTVKLTVDASMEPVWELVCDRAESPRTLSNRDRSLFGLVRLAGEDSRHLSWGQNSILSRLTDDTDEAASRLAEAYRTARASANLEKIQSLANAAGVAEGAAKELGAYVEGTYKPGLELGRGGFSSGSIALHDNDVPLRLAGLGTRRLATLAIQKSAITDGAIILLDEIEHGLEPHRIIGSISQLKVSQSKSINDNTPVGQVLMTTHSDVALGEVGSERLHVVRVHSPSKLTTLKRPTSPSPIQSLMRFTPRALFSKRVLVAEGNTEVGMLLGIRENWPARHANKPIEQLGSAIADGNGDQASFMALSLSGLGYATAIYRDSDTPISADNLTKLTAARIPIFEYGNALNSEQAIFYTAPDEQVEELLIYARAERGNDYIDDNLSIKLRDIPIDIIRSDFSNWELFTSLNGLEIRNAIAEVACRKKWFKDQRIGRGLAPIVWKIALQNPISPLASTLSQAEAWLYARN